MYYKKYTTETYTLNDWIIWYVNYISKGFYFLNRAKKKKKDTEATKKGLNWAFLKMKTAIYEIKITLDLINGW